MLVRKDGPRRKLYSTADQSQGIAKLTKCWIQPKRQNTSTNSTIRFIPTFKFGNWKEELFDHKNLQITKKHESYWIEEKLFLQTKNSFDTGAVEKVSEISLYLDFERSDQRKVYYVFESAEEKFILNIKDTVKKTGKSFSSQMVETRRGYFVA